MPIKILITLFGLYTMYKLILKFKDGNVTLFEYLLWNVIWLAVIVVTILPQTSDWFAAVLGFSGKGIETVSYIVIFFLVYAVYRMMLKIEHVEFEITQLVRHSIVQQVKKNKTTPHE